MPAQRDNDYNLLQVHWTDDSPDRRVDDWSTLREDLIEGFGRGIRPQRRGEDRQGKA